MTFYEPGTVAVISADFGDRGFTARGIRLSWGWSTENGEVRDHYVTGVRPLVTLDPEDLTVEDIKRAVRGWGHGPTERDRAATRLLRFAAQMEAQTRPSKPDEPTGLGAVVRVTSHRGAEYGNRLLVRGHATSQPWMGDGLKRDWDEIEGPIEVLAEGVPADAGRD